MEIGALLREVLRRAWVVAVLVALAAGGAWAATTGSKNLYRAKVEVTVPDTQSGSIGATGQYVADFVQAIQADSVTSAVAAETGVEKSDVKKGGSADQSGQSKFIVVVYQSEDKATVQAVATTLAKKAAAKVAESAVSNARYNEKAAKEDFEAAKAAEEKADAAVVDAQARAGGISPLQAHAQALGDLSQAQEGLQRARLRGDPTAAYQAQIDALQADMKAKLDAANAFQKLVTARDRADDELSAARGRLDDARKARRDAEIEPLVKPTGVEVTSGRVARIRAVMISAGIAAIIGFGLLVLLAGLTAGRGRRVQTFADAPLPGAPGVGAPADSLLGGFMAAPGGPRPQAPAGSSTIYQPPAAPPRNGAGHDDLIFPPSNPTQMVRRRDVR